jgi:hypothetical protein
MFKNAWVVPSTIIQQWHQLPLRKMFDHNQNMSIMLNYQI